MAGMMLYPKPPVLPYRPIQPKPRRPLWERRVTIAAGFMCDAGVVLCADTLLSANYRQQGPKVWLWHGQHDQVVAVTGAGNYVLLKLAKELIFKALDDSAGMRFQPGQVKSDIIEPVIAKIHDEHVDRASDWDRANGYGVSLVLAVRSRGQAILYETDHRACSEAASFACVGSGAPVGNYVASTVFYPGLALPWAQIAAAYVIQQAKAYGEDCGGDTNIVVVPHAAPAAELAVAPIREYEGYATEIHEGVGNLLLTIACSREDDWDLFMRLRTSVNHIAGRLAVASGAPVVPEATAIIRVKLDSLPPDSKVPGWMKPAVKKRRRELARERRERLKELTPERKRKPKGL